MLNLDIPTYESIMASPYCNGKEVIYYLFNVSVEKCTYNEICNVASFCIEHSLPYDLFLDWYLGRENPDYKFIKEAEEIWNGIIALSYPAPNSDYLQRLYFEKCSVSDEEMIRIKSDDDWIDSFDFAFPDECDLRDNSIVESIMLPPKCYRLTDFFNNPTLPPDELIGGILRKGHKMLISGPSKAGKSFLLMELAVSIAEGIEWLGFRCTQGKVLYINLEIDEASANNRFMAIYNALGIDDPLSDNIIVWHLRGLAKPLNVLVEEIVGVTLQCEVSCIIIDPIYKVITGDENSATDMTEFCNCFDMIVSQTHSSIVYAHHHSKGVQGAKKSMDRASGSGVFARDPDAVLDMCPLVVDKIPPDFEGATAFRIETNLREFKDIDPVNIWYKYPIHIIDYRGTLKDMLAEGGRKPNSDSKLSIDEKEKILEIAYNACREKSELVKVSDMAKAAKISERTVRNYIKETEKFSNVRGFISMKS